MSDVRGSPARPGVGWNVAFVGATGCRLTAFGWDTVPWVPFVPRAVPVVALAIPCGARNASAAG